MKTLFLKTSTVNRRQSIAIASQLIREGKLVAFPTETVYGLGANVYNTHAIRNIFRAKGRPQDNPLIVHIRSIDQVALLVRSIPIMFFALAKRFFPGPLTLVMKKSTIIPDIVTAGLSTVAIRMPDHPIARQLLKHSGVPIVAPSANLSGKPSPTSAEHVRDDLDGKIDAILDGGRCKIGVESTVLDITHGIPVILRPGGVTREEIEDVLQCRVRVARTTQKRPSSPGMKYTHYAPDAEVILFEGERPAVLHAMKQAAFRLKKKHVVVGIMASADFECSFKGLNFFSLGKSGAFSAAQLLYDGFRTLDRKGISVILCQGFTDTHIGSALMNRMRKAAWRRIRV
ncbi:MAG: L-threonylcarbamoyladenylate synthase [Bacteroidota bacterium]